MDLGDVRSIRTNVPIEAAITIDENLSPLRDQR